MKALPVFLFAFANDRGDNLSLGEEWKSIESALQSRERDLVINLTPSTQQRDIWDKLNHYHRKVAIFHYGGHSGAPGLNLEDIQLQGDNLATLLGQEDRLQLVFLNACENIIHVKYLLEKGVPAVIATSAPVSDTRSVTLAREFYGALAAGKTIRQAFEAAAAFLNNQVDDTLVQWRGLGLDTNSEALEWGLYVNPDRPEVQEWTIPEANSQTLSIKPAMREALSQQRANCEIRNVKFRSVHVMAALLQDSGAFIKQCLSLVDQHFYPRLQKAVDTFISRQPLNPKEAGFQDFRLDDHPILLKAGAFSRQEDKTEINEKYVFLAFLRSDASLNKWLKRELGEQAHTALMEYVSFNNPGAPIVGNTDFDF